MQPKTVIIFFLSFITIGFLYTSISQMYYSKQDYKLKVNFLVSTRYLDVKGYCDLYDKNRNPMPIKSHLFYKTEVEIGDSIVKKPNTKFVYIYRIKNHGNPDYYVAKQIELN
jgi:hypothetical protein